MNQGMLNPQPNFPPVAAMDGYGASNQNDKELESHNAELKKKFEEIRKEIEEKSKELKHFKD